MLRPLSKRVKTLLFVFLTPVVLFLVLWAYDSINRTLHPPQDSVIDLCPPDGKASNSAEKKECRWVVPVKYRPYKTNDGKMTEFTVPWVDIDPSFPSKNWVRFSFLPNYAHYKNSVQYRKKNQNHEQIGAYGLFTQSDGRYFFQGFDTTEVHVGFSPTSFQIPNPSVRIFRPLENEGTLEVYISLPKLSSEEEFEHYFKQHIHEIDQKLMEFISQWH